MKSFGKISDKLLIGNILIVNRETILNIFCIKVFSENVFLLKFILDFFSKQFHMVHSAFNPCDHTRNLFTILNQYLIIYCDCSCVVVKLKDNVYVLVPHERDY